MKMNMNMNMNMHMNMNKNMNINMNKNMNMNMRKNMNMKMNILPHILTSPVCRHICSMAPHRQVFWPPEYRPIAYVLYSALFAVLLTLFCREVDPLCSPGLLEEPRQTAQQAVPHPPGAEMKQQLSQQRICH